ncbi:MAG: hypothetical protein KBD94_03175 [Pyrinomonadaceae bacterium]|nr:hypothetical protein [Pyrinomonadaceae bacterium]
MNKVVILLVCAVAGVAAACGDGSSNNAATNTNMAPQEIKIDPANMPPGLSTTPLPMTGTPIPGIPTNGNIIVPKGTKPTPGIPSEKELKKGLKPSTTSTPGIPSQEQIRKMLNQANTQPPVNGAPPMMKSNRKLGGKP